MFLFAFNPGDRDNLMGLLDDFAGLLWTVIIG